MATKKQPAAYLFEQPKLNFEAADAFIASLKPPEEPVQKRGNLRALADLGLGVGQGAVQGVRMLTDVAGADNVVSGGLRKVEDFIGGLQSATVKADQQEISRILKEAEGAGVLDQVVAGFKAFAVAPGQLTANAVGTMIPTVGAALLPGVGQSALAARLAAGGVGAAQGVGSVKGAIYDEVKGAHEANGMALPDAQARAAQAQSYGGGSFNQIALGGVIGAAAGGALPGIGGGVEGAVRGIVRGSEKSSLNAAARIPAYGAAEAAPEFSQGAQEKYATNTALGGEGFAVDPMAGVWASGTMEGVAGGVVGGGAGAFNRRAPKVLVPEVGALSRAANIAPAPELPPEPPPPVPLTPEKTAELLGFANQRATALTEKAKGTKDAKTPDGNVTPGRAPEFLTPEEKQEQAAMANISAFSKEGQDGMRVFDRSKGAVPDRQPAEVFGAAPQPIEQPPAFEPDLTTPAAIYETLTEIEQRNDQTRRMYAQQPGDVLNNQGDPFPTKRAAINAQKKAGDGFEVVPADEGRFVVRPAKPATMLALPAPTITQEVANDDQRNVDSAAGRAVALGAGRTPEPVGGVLDVGRVASDAGRAEPVASGVAVASGEQTQPTDAGGRADAALTTLNALADGFTARGDRNDKTFATVLRGYAAEIKAGKIAPSSVAPQIEAYTRMLNKPAVDAASTYGYVAEDNQLVNAASMPDGELAPVARPNRRTKAVQQKQDQVEAQRADYFAPGNIVKSYGGHDEVVRYDPPDESGRWNVRVRAVVKQGDQWVPAQDGRRDAEERNHSTAPEAKELTAGPVRRSATKQATNAPEPQQAAQAEGTQEPAPPAAAGAAVPTAVGARAAATASNEAGRIAKPKVYKTRAGAEQAKSGNTQRLRKVDGGYILRNATDKEIASADRAGRRLASGGGVNVDRDPLLAAISKLGGLRMSERSDTVGEGNKNVGGKMLFTQNGKAIDDLARGALREFGYVPSYEVERDGGVRWLRDAIKAEFMGTQQHFSEQGTGWMEDRAGNAMLSDEEIEAARQAYAEEENERLSDWSSDDLADAGYTAASPAVQQATEEILAQAEALGIDIDAIKENADSATRGQPDDAYHTEVQRVAREAIEAVGGNAQGAVAEGPGGRDQDGGESAGDQGQEGLKLEAPTRAQVLAQQDALEQERADRDAPADKPKSRLTGEQVDIFNPQGSVFDVPAEDAAQPAEPSSLKARADAMRRKPADEAIDDLGEKIGGARKDTSVSQGAGGRRSATADDKRPAWARRFEISQIVAPGVMAGEVNNAGRWVIRDLRSLDWMKQAKQIGRDTYATKEEAEAVVPLAAVSLKHRAVPTRDGKYEIWRDITDRKRVKVVERVFDAREDAMAYMIANAVQIVETNTTFGEADMPLPPDRARTGPERRQGDVKGEDFMRTFGFRAVEFGNWNNQEERQALMNDAWDGMLDLADVLGVPPKALGLNGDLALAFGARGHGLQSARAHYEQDRAVINLTKEHGAGSLAHEWFHALDHYFGRQDGKASAKWETQADGTRRLKAKGEGLDMASSGFQRNNSGVRPELRDAYDKLLTTLFKKAEGYVEDTAKADKFTGRAKEDLAEALDKLRAGLSAQKDPTYYKRNNKPASAELLAEFDTVAKAMLTGDATALATEWRDTPGSKGAIASRWTNNNLERLSAIYKEVRGRTGFDGTNREGVFDRLRGNMDRYSQRLKMLADAQTGTEKTRMVPTEFAMNAKELDQGRGTDYWTTPHEMVARAFQGYVEDKIAERGGVSRFLNYGPENVAILTPWGAKRPFPAGTERKAINTALDGFVQALQTREDDAGNVAMYSRALVAAPPQVASSATPEGHKEYATQAVTLAFPQETERFEVIPDAGQQILSYAIMPADGFDVLGHVELLVEDGRPVSLLDIEVYADKGRRSGVGRATIEALLAAHHDADLNISNIVPEARGFWERMGVPQQNVEGAYDGTLNWEIYATNHGAASGNQETNRYARSQGNTSREGASSGDSQSRQGLGVRGTTAAALRTLLEAAFGPEIIGALEKAGLLTIADRPGAGMPADAAGVSQGGGIVLFAANIAPGSVSVAYHEALHATLRKTIGEDTYTALMARLAKIDAAAAKDGPVSRFFKQAAGRIPDDITGAARTEELAAYAVEQWQKARESMPFVLKRWVGDFIAAIRAGMVKALQGAGLGVKLRARLLADPATLHKLASDGLKAMARQGVGGDMRDKASQGMPMFSRTIGAAPEADAAPFNVKGAVGRMLAHYRGMAMQALGRLQIVDLYTKDIPALKQYNDFVRRMEADKNEAGAEADILATTWGKLPDEKQLAELMHDATLAGFDADPKAPIDPKDTRATKGMSQGDTSAEHGRLRRAFNTLTPEAQAVYRQARDTYTTHHTKVRQAIRERIERSELSPERRRKLLEKMDGEFFKKVQGVYFPLSRFGEYVVVVRDEGGEAVSVNRAETINEASAVRAELLKAFPRDGGFTVGKVLKSKEFNAARDGVGRGFMAELFETLEKEGADETLQDTIAQLYLAALPDLSWAKHGIHRKGTPGFSQNARRAFAQNAFHGARYLAKLRYADKLQTELTNMQEHVDSKKEDEAYDSIEAQQVVDEMGKRHDSLMNPKSHPLSTALTSFGFIFHLGLSPASAMVNLTQTALVAYPMMGAKWGFTKAASALMAASKEAAGNRNDISRALTGDERRAYEEAVRAGTIDVTMANDLAGIAQGEDEKVSAKLRPVMKAASFMFHHAERFNRQVTFVAAYRLAREAGAAHDVAFEQATDATYGGHFDYAACVDDETEILTHGGWKRRIELREGDVAIATDAEGRAVESKVLAINVYEGEHEIIEFSASKRFNMALTPNHDCVIQNYNSRDKKWQSPKKVRADSLKNHHFILRAPLAEVERPDTFGEDVAALLGWIAAEGWYAKYRKCTKATDVRLGQSESHNPEHTAEIRALLQRVGPDEFKEYTYDRVKDRLTTFVLRRSLGRRVQELMPNKVVTPEMVGTMSAREMRSFIMAFIKGDGHKSGQAWTVGQKGGANLDLLQAMATMCGMRASLGGIKANGMADLYLVPEDSGCRSHTRPLERTSHTVPLVWCPTTEHGTWVARRRGAVFVTGNSNRPRIMQGNVAKVVLLFKQFGQNMVYTLMRQAYLSMKGETPAQRAESRKAFAGLLTMHAVAAGGLGLPLVSTLLAAASAIGSTDDEPWDAEAALKNMLADAVGSKAAEVMAHGLLRLTPWDISGRVALNKLILPDMQEGLEGAKAAEAWMTAALGPVAGIGVNFMKGMEFLSKGDALRGFEAMAPAALRGPLKATRYGLDGAIDKSGIPILDEVSGAGIAGQVLGLSPSEVSQAMSGRRAIYKADKALQERRGTLMREYAQAFMVGDTEGAQDVRNEIAEFNKKNPGRAIKPANLRQSVAARRKRIADSEQGVYLPKNRRDAMEAGGFAAQQKP